MYNKIFRSVIFVLFLGMMGCSTNEIHSFNCLPEVNNFYYEYDKYTSRTERILSTLPDDWKLEIGDANIGLADQVVAIGDKQIWLLGANLTLYTPENRQIKNYSIEWKDKSDIPRTLFLSQSGILWGLGFHGEGRKPILSRYNAIKDLFEPVIDNKQKLIINGPLSGEIDDDSKGLLWIALENEGVFVYNPDTDIVEQIILGEDITGNRVTDIEVDSHDRVWVEVYEYGVIDSHAIFQYDPISKKQVTLALPPIETDNPRGLLIDRKARLWLSDFAFWTIESNFPNEGYDGWNLMLRSPIFITKNYPFVKYRWIHPKPILEDLKGNIWFSGHTLGKLDTNTGEWCKVIDGFAEIDEDSNGIYWTAINGKLYRHD